MADSTSSNVSVSSDTDSWRKPGENDKIYYKEAVRCTVPKGAVVRMERINVEPSQ